MSTIQVTEQTTLGAGLDALQLGKTAGMNSYLWKGLSEKFLKGEPRVSGVLQILTALMILSLGIITMALFGQFYSIQPRVFGIAYPFWGPVMFIVSGSVSIAAGTKTTKGLVRSSMGLNIASSVVASFGFFFSIIRLTTLPYVSCEHSSMSAQCNQTMAIVMGMYALVIILSLLEFFITVSLSAFGCKVTCCNPSGVVVIMPSSLPVSGPASAASLQGSLMPPAHQEKSVPENLH